MLLVGFVSTSALPPPTVFLTEAHKVSLIPMCVRAGFFDLEGRTIQFELGFQC